MPPVKLLFICSRNEIRSLTAERLFDGSAQYQARSAGTQPQARVKITEGLLGWADLVFVMEKSHLRRLEERFPEAMAGKTVICLNVPDDYAYMDPALIEEFEGKLPAHLPAWPPRAGEPVISDQLVSAEEARALFLSGSLTY